jgi:integrase
VTFFELAQEFIAMGVYSPDTQSKIKTAAELFDRRANVSVEDLSIRAIGDFKDSTLKVAKVISYNGYLRYLRLITDFAVTRGYVETNLFRMAKLGTVGQPVHKIIEDDTLVALLMHIESCEHLYEPVWFWRSLIYTLYFTGMRRRQLVMLTLGDIDFEKKEVHLRYESSKTRRAWSIPLHCALEIELIGYINDVESDICRALTAQDALFNIARHNDKFSRCKVNPGHMPARAVTDFFKRINKRTQLQVGAHKFRHTLATKVCNPEEGECDIFVAQQLLGHTMIQTTRGYVKTPISRMRLVLDKIKLPNR